MKTADEIRSTFLKYFEDRGHRAVRSSSLVPESDPTLLFANAGMNQFKDVFLGKEKRDYKRATSSQKCVRAGGKHNDLENVGQTARHHTFFEMLGNFSFGDYFKKDAIAFAWELLTKDLALGKDRLVVTIFRGDGAVPRDTEAHGFWKAHVAEDRILELGMKDNFWAMGDTGPCGPCSEIHFFQGDSLPCPEVAAGRACLGVECECDRWLEIWNLVFMQYNRDAAGTLNALPAPCVDTGMGLERIAAVVQGKLSNYDSDLFTPLLAAVAQRAGKTYGAAANDDMSMRVVADHSRAITFLISDGVLPGNEGRGYVLRKIVRRASRHGGKLGIEGAFLYELIDAVVNRMSGAFPELVSHAASVRRAVQIEEERFLSTLKTGLVEFDKVAASVAAAAEIARRTFDSPSLRELREAMARQSKTFESMTSQIAALGNTPEFVKLRETIAKQAEVMEATIGQELARLSGPEQARALRESSPKTPSGPEQASALRESSPRNLSGPEQARALRDSPALRFVEEAVARRASTLRDLAKLEGSDFAEKLKSLQADPTQGVTERPRLSGPEMFRLYDTYGFPPDLTEELAKDRDVAVDREGFDRELQAQQERARNASKMGAVTGDPVYLGLLEQRKPEFLGYDSLVVEDAQVLAVLKNGALASRLDAGEEGEVVLDRTPFYGESGGQVGDHGVLSSEGSAAQVTDCQLPIPGLYVHHVKVTAGGFERGMTVRAEVDAQRRAGAMRHHTGTHLLHAALREILGPHVKQAGSLVAPARLRFDFSHYTGVTPPELRHIENRVNGQILQDSALEKKVMGREEALAYGALAFFGDKYGERVRVVEIPGFSKEFCGGTHVPRTGEIGLFLFTAEQGIAAGTRRVEALTGEAAMERAQNDQSILEELEASAKVDRGALVDEYAKLREQLKAREREIQALKMKLATGGPAAGATQDLVEVGGVQLWTPRFEGLDRKAHAAVVDDFRNRNKDRAFVLVSASIDGEGVNVISAVSESLKDRVKAPEVMKRLGLRGGGRPDFAQGGGIAPGDVESLRKKAGDVLREMLEGVGV